MNESYEPQKETVEETQGWKKGLFTVTPLSKYFAMALFIAMPFIGFWLGILYERYTNTVCPEVVTPFIKEVVKTEAPSKVVDSKPETIKTFSDSETGVSFSYPTDWGEVTFNDERGECDETAIDPCNMRTYSFEDLVEGGIFLVMETRGHEEHPIGRGAFWGDEIGSITPTFTDECSSDEKCELFTNDSGVVFAKRTRILFDWVMEDNIEFVYDTYVEKNPYYAVRLSPIRIKSAGNPIEKMFEDIVVSSLTLTSH